MQQWQKNALLSMAILMIVSTIIMALPAPALAASDLPDTEGRKCWYRKIAPKNSSAGTGWVECSLVWFTLGFVFVKDNED